MEKLSIDPELLIQVERKVCKESFYEFFLSFWDTIVEEQLVDNWHIKYLCDELQRLSKYIVARKPKPYDLIINVPPGTSKSTITTIMFPAWLWTQDPSLRIITNSYASDLSIEHAVKSRDIITSDKFRLLFPEIKLRQDKAAKGSYENTGKGARYTTSTGSAITGKHGHVIINDDPQNPKQAESKVKREEANEHTKTLSSRKVEKANTPIITIQQRLHDNDTTGYLVKKKSEKLKHICLPCRDSNNVFPSRLSKFYVNGLLDPLRLSEDVLQEAYVDLGGRQFAGQFEQTPSEKGGNIFKRDWFGTISYVEFNRLKGFKPIHFFADTAYTEKHENDPTGMIATCYFDNTLYITNAVKVRKKFPDLCRFMPAWALQNFYTKESTIRIEPKANGISVIDQLRAVTQLNVVRTPSPKEDKETRANAVSPTVEANRVVLVEGAWNSDFLDEVCGFPRMEHDEYVDVLGYAINYHLKANSGWRKKQLQKARSLMR